MTGLVLKLKPNEKFLVNGIAFQNGAKAARIRVRSRDVAILRERDAMHWEESTTPLRKVYYVAQLAMAGEADANAAAAEIIERLAPLAEIFVGDASRFIESAREAAESRKFFAVMRSVKKLFQLEDALLLQRA